MVSQQKTLEIINNNDPMGLIESGAPKDEYISEADFIAESMNKYSNERELRKAIISHFKDQFDQLTIIERVRLRRVSRQIWEQVK